MSLIMRSALRAGRPVVARTFCAASNDGVGGGNVPYIGVPFKNRNGEFPDCQDGMALDAGEHSVAKMYDSLEWVCTSPPPVHQFNEPPILLDVEGAAARREHH